MRSTLLSRTFSRHLFVTYISVTYESIQYQKYSPKFTLRKYKYESSHRLVVSKLSFNLIITCRQPVTFTLRILYSPVKYSLCAQVFWRAAKVGLRAMAMLVTEGQPSNPRPITPLVDTYGTTIYLHLTQSCKHLTVRYFLA
jgi:hypothetical protein